MVLLPAEIINEILLQVDKSTLFDAAQVCKQWRQLALVQVVPIKIYQHFKHACTIGDQLSIIQSNCVQDWLNDGFIAACQAGQQKLVRLLIAKGANDWNRALSGACEGGHEDIAQLMISKGANDWNDGLYYGCIKGYEDIVQLMIAKGANNWNKALNAAYEAGHQKLVRLMISKNADSCNCRKLLALH